MIPLPRRRWLRRLSATVVLAALVVVWHAAPAAAGGLDDWADRREGARDDLVAAADECDAWLEDGEYQHWVDGGCEEILAADAATNGATDAWLASTGGARTTPGWSISRYSLYYDGGGIGDLFFRKMLGGVTAGVWTASVMLLRVAVWAMDWVAAGRLTEIIGAIPLEVAQLLQTDIVAGLQLRYFALTVMGMVSAWAIARQRLAEAAGNMAFAIIALSVGAILLSNLGGYYEGAKRTKDLLVEAALGDGSGPLDAAAMTAPLMDSIVHTPWEQLNFGRALTGDCEIGAGVDILERGPGPGDHYPRLRIKSCPDGRSLDVFNRYPSLDRLFGTVIVAVGQAFVGLLIMSAAILGLTAELLVAAAFASLPVVAVIVAFPGGRPIAGSWASMLVRGVVGLAVGVLGLRLLVIVMEAIAANSAAYALLERFVLFALVAFAGWRMRKMVPAAASKISATLGGKVATAGSRSGGGSAGGVAGGVAGGIAGGAVGGLAAGAVASQVMPAQGAARAARHAASGLGRVGRAATGAAGAAAAGSGSEGKVATLLGNTRAAGGAGLAAATAAAAGSAIARKSSISSAAGGAESLDQKALHELATGKSKRGQLVAARHPNTAQADRDLVASSGHSKKVIKAAAPHVSAEKAHELGQHRSRGVRAAAAGGAHVATASAQQFVTRGRTKGALEAPAGTETRAQRLGRLAREQKARGPGGGVPPRVPPRATPARQPPAASSAPTGAGAAPQAPHQRHTSAPRAPQAAPAQEPQPATPPEPQPATPLKPQPATPLEPQPATPPEPQPPTPPEPQPPTPPREGPT